MTRPPWSDTSISERETDFSAGGLVVRGDEVVVIVPAHSAMHHEVLALPKGHPDPGETPLQAAAREVREETGVEVEPIRQLGEIDYTYERAGREVYKRVAFYLFAYRGGELSHDHEIADVLWMPLEEAARTLTHAGEREMVRRALSRSPEER
jgi:ADP-ribose pyrophosphatase YjhB (NUDIX family)